MREQDFLIQKGVPDKIVISPKQLRKKLNITVIQKLEIIFKFSVHLIFSAFSFTHFSQMLKDLAPTFTIHEGEGTNNNNNLNSNPVYFSQNCTHEIIHFQHGYLFKTSSPVSEAGTDGGLLWTMPIIHTWLSKDIFPHHFLQSKPGMVNLPPTSSQWASSNSFLRANLFCSKGKGWLNDSCNVWLDLYKS